jgi:iron-sulfur cluster assembly protein
MEFPFTLTPEAHDQAVRMLQRKGLHGHVLRVGVKGGGCSGLEYVMRPEAEARPDDLSLDMAGLTVVCDPKSAKFLVGTTVVWTGNLIGGGFGFENPNAARSCGCGTSFTPKL